MGEATDGFLGNLKDIQKKALKAEWVELAGKPNDLKRLTRSDKEKQKEAAIDEAIAAEESKHEEVIDLHAMSPDTDILTTFNGDWIATT